MIVVDCGNNILRHSPKNGIIDELWITISHIRKLRVTFQRCASNKRGGGDHGKETQSCEEVNQKGFKETQDDQETQSFEEASLVASQQNTRYRRVFLFRRIFLLATRAVEQRRSGRAREELR